MTKYLFSLLLLVMFSSFAFSQQNYQDVVYLKNGSVIRGMIIEQVPNKSIKIETSDKSLFVYPIDEVEKITKEVAVNDSKSVKLSAKRKGYIGISIGPSIPVGAFADHSDGAAKTGVQLNLANFGYLFTENIGIAAIWFGAANPVSEISYNPWSYGGLMAGPLLSFPVSNTAEWDFRPMIGYSVTTVSDVGQATDQATAFAINLGTVLRFNLNQRFSITLSADYFSTKPNFKVYGFEQKIGTVSLGFGAAYRLK